MGITDHIDRIDDRGRQLDAFEVSLEEIEHPARLRRVDRLERTRHPWD
jgi:hypothetical protein